MERSAPIDQRYDKMGPRVAEALRRRHMGACYCPTAAEALKAILERIPREHTVSWGGSETLRQLGVQEALLQRGQTVIDRDLAKTPEERDEAMHRALLCDTFLMSSNAVSEGGELVNIDGNGNRVAALIYGPKQVIVAVGMNKVAQSLEGAVRRARTIASPANTQRFDIKTPCKVTGMCADCQSPDCICAQMVITRFCRPEGRIQVVLIGETLGF